MVVPIPAFLLDAFFILNIMISLAVLMVALNAQKPLDFSAFPTVLLFATLFRLGLNVASTRVVLVHGHEGGERRRPCHRGVRHLHDRRRLCRRPGRVRRHRDHQHDRGHQGCRPRLGSQRALHARRAARQADGDRRRSQRRPDHADDARKRRDGSVDRSRFLRRDGRFLQIREGRCHRRPADPRDQRDRRPDPRRGQPPAWQWAKRRFTYVLLAIGDALVAQVPALLLFRSPLRPSSPASSRANDLAGQIGTQFGAATRPGCRSPSSSACSACSPACRIS